jgi:tetratricopeptide (TPR) repeat protein
VPLRATGPWILGLGLFVALAGTAKAATDSDANDCERGSPTVAIVACTKIFEDPAEGELNRTAALAARGLAYFRQREYDRAIADYSEAIRINPDYSRAYMRRGSAYLAKREFAAAIADLDAAIRINPGNAEAFMIRGAAFEASGNLDRAIVD